MSAIAADEYAEAAQCSCILGWIGLFLAGFFLLHDVYKAAPWLAPRLRKVSPELLALLAVPFVVLDLRAYRRGPGQPA